MDPHQLGMDPTWPLPAQQIAQYPEPFLSLGLFY